MKRPIILPSLRRTVHLYQERYRLMTRSALDRFWNSSLSFAKRWESGIAADEGYTVGFQVGVVRRDGAVGEGEKGVACR